MARRKAGLSWAVVAGLLGVRTRQGAEAAYRRLRNVVVTRGEGRRDHRDERRSRSSERLRAAWLRRNTRALRGLAARLEGHRRHLPAGLLGELDHAYLTTPARGEVASPGFAAHLALLIDGLAASDQVPTVLNPVVAEGKVLMDSMPRLDDGG